MARTPEEFLRRVTEEEPHSLEGGIAKQLLRYMEGELCLEDSEEIFETCRNRLLDEVDAVSALQSQFLREQYDEYRKEEEGEDE